jgi:hypothetical protein
VSILYVCAPVSILYGDPVKKKFDTSLLYARETEPVPLPNFTLVRNGSLSQELRDRHTTTSAVSRLADIRKHELCV